MKYKEIQKKNEKRIKRMEKGERRKNKE